MSARILIGDDSLIDCQLAAMVLALSGNHPTDIGRSSAGIRDQLRLRQYDLIILDYHLDDGVAEPILRLAEARQRKARVLMVSGDEHLASCAHQLSPRIDAFLPKGPGYAQALAAYLAEGIHPLRRRIPQRGPRQGSKGAAPTVIPGMDTLRSRPRMPRLWLQGEH